MIEIEVTVTDLAQVRFTTDAVWETAASLHALVFQRAHLLHQRLRRLVPARPDFDLALLTELAGDEAWLPDVFAPVPSVRPAHPLEQLDAVRRTPLPVAGSDLAVLQARGSSYASLAPQEYLDRTADALLGWWAGVLEPLWDRVDAIQRADIAHHQGRLATRGLAATLADLHRGLSFADGRLRVDLGPGTQPLHPDGRGIWLVPTVFRWPWLALDTRDGVAPVISYGARGAGRVWQRSAPSAPAGLPDLIGRSRALILECLDVPRSTTALARSFGLSISTVSEHLGVMVQSGLLSSRRDGQQVLYWRTPVGDLLVGGEESARLLG